MSKISCRPCPDYTPENVRAALCSLLEPLGGLEWVTPGMKIAVKVNLVSAMKPERAAVTHPALVRELAAMLAERGAEVTVGDSPGGIYNRAYVERVYSVCGMHSVCRESVRLNYNFAQSEADFPQARVLKHFIYTSWLDEADAIIDFCKLKTHGMMSLSAAVKNLFGVIPGTVKPEYHYKYPNHRDFADMLVDLCEYFRPRLSIVDGVVAMEGNGPTAGTPRHMGVLLAGSNPYELDLACAELIGLSRKDVPYLEAAYRRGLLTVGPEELDTDGDLAAFKPDSFRHVQSRHNITSIAMDNGPLMGMLTGAARLVLKTRPQLERDMCVGCGVCADVCPAKAISVAGKKAVISRKKCIRCFCCQEFCPRGAMKVHRAAASRFIGRM